MLENHLTKIIRIFSHLKPKKGKEEGFKNLSLAPPSPNWISLHKVHFYVFFQKRRNIPNPPKQNTDQGHNANAAPHVNANPKTLS